MESPGPDPDWAVIVQEARAYEAWLEANGCTHQAAQEIFNLPVEQAVAGARELVGSLRASLDYTINHFRETADMLERANWRLAQYQFAVSMTWMEIKEKRDGDQPHQS